MALIVQKFGGSSVADAERVNRVAGIIADTYRAGNDVIVVLSAQGDTTDDLIAKAHEINPNPSRREMDMLMSTGEQISIALCAMALERMGLSAVSLTGWQIGMITDNNYMSARIKKVRAQRIREELGRRRIVLVAGFQGINQYNDVTTLGRGGSDTTAVAIAAEMKADLCQIYTDVEGVFTADPRKVSGARKLEEITYDEMLELATLGAKVLHNRSVELAKKYNVEMEVLSSFERKPGTIVKEVTKVEQTKISGVAVDNSIVRIAVVGLNDTPGVAYKLFGTLAKKGINIDIILQSIGRGGTKDISFTIDEGQLEQTKTILEDLRGVLKYDHVDIGADICKLSIVGAGLASNPGIAAQMFEALYNAHVNIRMISTSEIKLSVLIERSEGERAMQAVHNTFFDIV